MFNGKVLQQLHHLDSRQNVLMSSLGSSLDGVHLRIDHLEAIIGQLSRSVVAMSKANSDRLIEMAMVKQGQSLEAVQHRRAAAGENMQNVREEPVDDSPQSLDDFDVDVDVIDLNG